MLMDLSTPIQDAGRIYKAYSSRLEKLGILTLFDFLYFIPTRYEDYSLVSRIGQVQAGEVVTLRGQVLEIKNEYTRNFKKLQKAVIADKSGSIEIIWFNQPFLIKYIHVNDTLSVSGRVDFYRSKLMLQSPDYEVLTQNSINIHTGRLVPVYHETKGVTSKWIRRQIYKLLGEYKNDLTEFLPDRLIKENHFMELGRAIETVHFPENYSEALMAKERLAFDELFLLQLRGQERRFEWNKNMLGKMFQITKYQPELEKLISSLPFTLTQAQQLALKEITSDLGRKTPMNRLLQGDVGSGKTIVSAIAMYLAFLNGFQSTLMAPTEILAQQHFATISKLLLPFGVKVDLVTGSKKLVRGTNYEVQGTEKSRNSKFLIRNSDVEFDILVGTHAVLSEKIKFQNLGLVIIDEQQRFGVRQRGIIRSKGQNPHLLTMTATPIPRTVALTMYGDLDLSYLFEMPRGRKIVKTWLVPEEKRDGAYDWIRKQILTHNSQAFIICPFIDESESMQTVKAASIEFERLRKDVFPDLKLGLLHGKLKAKEKNSVLTDFKDKKFHILVATPVVEVGIDIANATIIMIEASERFGLSQLHQLRGRVGRGDKQSYCLLFTQSNNTSTLTRLQAMEKSNIGSELAELDLKLRGPGDIYGTTQHGLPRLKVANFSDFPLIQKAKDSAAFIFPRLSSYPKLVEKIEKLEITDITPD